MWNGSPTGECNASAGMVFMDIISNLERVSDHAYNLAGYVKDEMCNDIIMNRMTYAGRTKLKNLT